jgi:hypothetical protein
MHDHLQSAMPSGSFPVFWCENCELHSGSIILHYYSVRGALLGGVVVGITKEVAKTYFDVDVTMDKIASQGEEGSECTSWRITAVDPNKKHKLTENSSGDLSILQETINRRKSRRPTLQSNNRRRGSHNSLGSSSTVTFDPFCLPPDHSNLNCPFSRPPGEPPDSEEMIKSKLIARRESIENLAKLAEETKISRRGSSQDFATQEQNGKDEKTTRRRSIEFAPSEYEYGLSSSRVRSIFPYHVVSKTSFHSALRASENSRPHFLMISLNADG